MAASPYPDPHALALDHDQVPLFFAYNRACFPSHWVLPAGVSTEPELRRNSEKYWQNNRSAENAFPNFVDLITPDELAGLAMEPEVDSRLVSHFNGNGRPAMVRFERFDDLGNSVGRCWQAVNHWHMPATETRVRSRVLPDWRLDDLMILLPCRAAAIGSVYPDQYDVFIISRGWVARRWRVGDSVPMRQFCPRIRRCCIVDPFEPIIDEDLAPGDILYIPPGFPARRILPMNGAQSLVGFRGPNGRDLISSFADYAGKRSPGESTTAIRI